MFTISAIVGSAILYRDFDNMDAHRLINFLFGCLTTFAGVFTLTRHNEEEGAESGTESVDGPQGERTERTLPLGLDEIAVPLAVPRRARPLSMVGKVGKAPRALTTGSVPTVNNVQNLAPGGLVTTLTPVSSSLTSTSGSAPKYIVTRRSIFNPAFPVAFIESSSNRRL